MDECFAESLVYSDSDKSEGEERGIESTHIQNYRNPAESDEDDMNKSLKRTKKHAKFLSSDDENEKSDNESRHTEEAQESIKSTFNMRPSICDSDTKSSSDGNQNDSEIETKNVIKKFKKKKTKIQKHKQTAKGSGSDSESDIGGAEDDKENSMKPKHKRGDSKLPEESDDSSASDSSSADSNNQTDTIDNIKPREKTVQRMSAQMAQQQMKEIQSESQRMARERSINIPYHKPKSYSLKEFLSRRNIVEQQENTTKKPLVKAAVAIKMSDDDVAQYLNGLKKREKFTEQFFKDEEADGIFNTIASDHYHEREKHGGIPETKAAEKVEEQSGEIQSIECKEFQENPNSSPIRSQINEGLANSEESNNQIDQNENDDQTHGQNITIESADLTDLQTDNIELSDELNTADTLNTVATNKITKPIIPTDFVPKLKGFEGSVIDLETNDVKPKQKTGINELFERFMENAIAKPQKAETQEISIFRTDTGSIEKHTVHVNVDNMKPTREPRPGESHFKLQAELSRIMKEKREKSIAQRLQEEKEQNLSCKQMEIEDEEEFDDLSDGEKSSTEPNENAEELEDDDGDELNELIDNNDEENMEAEGQQDSENSDEDESDEADIEVDINAVHNPRKRILIAMDDDSDAENPAKSLTIEDYGSSQQIENHSTQSPSEEESKEVMNISELESEILQLSSVTDPESNKKEATKLFDECDGDDDIGESQLMALCSGSFATQNLNKQLDQYIEQTQVNESTEVIKTQLFDTDEVSQAKRLLLSSDEEDEKEMNEDVRAKKKSKKKKKTNTLVYSDDEEEYEEELEEDDQEEQETKDDDELSNNEADQESVEDEEQDLGERFIEYDSDENEIEVNLKKEDVRKKVSDFFEDEAELSESEWGSEDEDEKHLNRYEAELGDADRFDKTKLKGELERIRLREQMDQDSRELRILTERFIEEEDGGQERERKFRWKHLNNTDLNDDQIRNVDQEETGLGNSDEEDEESWRRMRYEREQLLKQQMSGDKDMIVEQTLTTLEIADHTMNQNGSTTTILNSSRPISIIKPVVAATSKPASPFLITNGGVNMMHYNRKSFLNRDSSILKKLASLCKAGGENEPVLNTAKGKGNYVFVATEKRDSVKRKSDSETGGSLGAGSMMNPCKKSKLNPKDAKLRPQTKIFFESLN